MVYSHVNSKGQTYFLHQRNVTLRGGRKQTIYFFSREQKEGVMNELPAGYEVMENKRTGLPMLRKSKKK